jgi:ubiquinone/menaquinone biosynthesis C-methylase UbiE
MSWIGRRRGATPAPAQSGPDSAALGLLDAGLSGWYDNSTDEVYRGIPIGPDDVVVDVGCGDGGTLSFCANRGAHVIAVDIDNDSLAAARDRLAATDARATEIHLGAAEAVPVASGTATRVICTEVLEHVDDPVVVMAELVRIAGPGALFLLTVPDALQEQMQRHVAPESYFQKPNHIRVFERADFAQLVTEAGLEIVSQDTYGFFWSIWWALFWGAQVELTDTSHPVLDHWTQAWAHLLETPRGRELKQQLDQFLPKSQVIVARKPG